MRLIHDPEWETCYFEITQAEKDLLDRAYAIPLPLEVELEVDSIMRGGPIWKPPSVALREAPEVKALEERAYALANDVLHLPYARASAETVPTIMGIAVRVVDDPHAP